MFQKSIIPVLVFLCAPLIHAEELETYILLDSYTHSEPMAIKTIHGDWDGQLYSGEQAFSVNRAEMGSIDITNQDGVILNLIIDNLLDEDDTNGTSDVTINGKVVATFQEPNSDAAKVSYIDGTFQIF